VNAGPRTRRSTIAPGPANPGRARSSRGETPLEAARRELAEETGLEGVFPAGVDGFGVDGSPPGLIGYEEHPAGSKGLHMTSRSSPTSRHAAPHIADATNGSWVISRKGPCSAYPRGGGRSPEATAMTMVRSRRWTADLDALSIKLKESKAPWPGCEVGH
jgi:hypothetical protein